jgi:hypothetical protein
LNLFRNARNVSFFEMFTHRCRNSDLNHTLALTFCLGISLCVVCFVRSLLSPLLSQRAEFAAAAAAVGAATESELAHLRATTDAELLLRAQQYERRIDALTAELETAQQAAQQAAQQQAEQQTAQQQADAAAAAAAMVSEKAAVERSSSKIELLAASTSDLVSANAALVSPRAAVDVGTDSADLSLATASAPGTAASANTYTSATSSSASEASSTVSELADLRAALAAAAAKADAAQDEARRAQDEAAAARRVHEDDCARFAERERRLKEAAASKVRRGQIEKRDSRKH